MITKRAEWLLSLGKKKREVEAEARQLFESIKQEMHKLSEYELFGTMLSNIETQPIEWLWYGRLPLEKTIKRRKAKLVVLDPLMAVLGRDVSASNDQDIREVLTPLAQLAERTKCAILIIRHLNKGTSSNPLYRGTGSIGIIGAARVSLIVVQDPYLEKRCILATTKNNLSKRSI
jgi:RecA-family ATPase